MFKELGALIDAAGEVVAQSMKISAKAVKEALSDKDDEDDHLMGLVEIPDGFRELELGETIELKEYKSKDGYIIVNADEVDEDE